MFAERGKEMAKRVIEHFGDMTTAVFSHTTTTIDPGTELPTDVTVTDTVTIAVTGVGDSGNPEIALGDRRIFALPDDFVNITKPDERTTVVFNSITYRIIAPLEQNPGGGAMYWEFMVRESGG